MKVYTLSFFIPNVDRQEVQSFLESRTEVLNWLSMSSTTYFFVSNSNIKRLQDIFSLRFYYNQFIIVETEPGKFGGRAYEIAWDFINNPKSNRTV